MRIGFLADLHLDLNGISEAEAIEVITNKVNTEKLSYLFIAGDTYESGLKTRDFVHKLNKKLKGKAEVYYILGNHEMFTPELNSYELLKVFEDKYYINNKVIELPGTDTVIVGFNGWYDETMFIGTDLPKAEELRRLEEINTDAKHMRNNKTDLAIVSDVIKGLEPILQGIPRSKDIIAVTHYVPFEAYVEQRPDDAWWTMCNAFVGSHRVGKLLDRYCVNRTIFGHTHIRFRETAKAVCKPLGYKFQGHWLTDSFEEELSSVLTVMEVT